MESRIKSVSELAIKIAQDPNLHQKLRKTQLRQLLV